MKIKVLKRFHDKETDKVYNVGEIVEVTNQRGLEIISNPFDLAEKISVDDVVTENVTTEKPKTTRKKK